MLSWRIIASSGPGSVATSTGPCAFFPRAPFWPVSIHYAKVTHGTPSDTFQLKELILRQATVREQKWASTEHVPVRWINRCTWTQLRLTVSHFWIWSLARLSTIGWRGVVAQTTPFLHKNAYMNVHSTIIHKSQKVKTTRMPMNCWLINKMWYTHTMEYYSGIKSNEVLIQATKG